MMTVRTGFEVAIRYGMVEADPCAYRSGIEADAAHAIHFHQRAANQQRIGKHHGECSLCIKCSRVYLAGFDARRGRIEPLSYRQFAEECAQVFRTPFFGEQVLRQHSVS